MRNETVFAENPLGKVPVLLRPDRAPIFDSDVICAYLDTLHDGQPLIPPAGDERWRALAMQAVAQGMSDAGIAVRWKTVRRPTELRFVALAEGYVEKLVASYDRLERELDAQDVVHIGHVAVATALSWLEFRELPTFSIGRSRLLAWLDAFEQRPSMLSTPLSGETVDA